MPNTQRQIRNKQSADVPMYITIRNSSVVEQQTLNLSVEGSNPSREAIGWLLNSRLQASSRKVERLNMSKVARWKVVRMLAVKGETLAIELGSLFPVGLVRLPVVGGLLYGRATQRR